METEGVAACCPSRLAPVPVERRLRDVATAAAWRSEERAGSKDAGIATLRRRTTLVCAPPADGAQRCRVSARGPTRRGACRPRIKTPRSVTPLALAWQNTSVRIDDWGPRCRGQATRRSLRVPERVNAVSPRRRRSSPALHRMHRPSGACVRAAVRRSQPARVGAVDLAHGVHRSAVARHTRNVAQQRTERLRRRSSSSASSLPGRRRWRASWSRPLRAGSS